MNTLKKLHAKLKQTSVCHADLVTYNCQHTRKKCSKGNSTVS